VTTKEILVPDIGDFQDVEIIDVLVALGDSIALDDPLITLESDKAAMDVPSPKPGTVKELKVNLGDKVSEGDLILLLDVAEAEEASEAEAPAPSETIPATTAREASAPPPTAGVSFERVHASPSVRRIARERRIDLNQVKGTGRKGRVTKEDLDRFEVGKVAPAATQGTPAIPPIPAVDFAKFGEIEAQPLSKIKRLTGINLSRAWLNVPHVTHHDEVDITDLEAFRQALKPRAEKAGVRVTLLSFFMKACAVMLQAFPSFNASLDPSGENLIFKKYYHIGIAVDTPNGLVVPVIRDVEKKGLFDLSAELAEVSGKARDKKLTPVDMQGGTFTISSLGGIGGTSFTPIVNAPEVAILGLTRSQQKPIPQGEGFEFRLMQPMSLSYDHRVIDGAEAARFVKQLGELVNDIRLLLT
jgi:pyruvate dehydrogenase E2 component (dihydrolipoamide acetyltransferase)